MSVKSDDKWQRLSSMADAASKLLLPLVIAGVGVVFSYFQHRSDVEQRKADRVTSFITHLASDNDEEKELALRVMNVLIDEGQLPPELGPALISSAADTNKTISQLSQGALTKLTRKDSSLEKTFVQAVQQNPEWAQRVQARVIIHVSSKNQSKLVEQRRGILEKNGFSVPEIEIVEKEALPKRSQLRFYRDNETAQAGEIIRLLNEAGLTEVKPILLPEYADKVRPRTYELWLGSNTEE